MSQRSSCSRDYKGRSPVPLAWDDFLALLQAAWGERPWEQAASTLHAWWDDTEGLTHESSDIDDLMRAFVRSDTVKCTVQLFTSGGEHNVVIHCMARREVDVGITTGTVAEAERVVSAIREVCPEELSSPYASTPYVALSRIEELHAAPTTRYDTARLVRYCEEINDAAARGNWFSVAFLVRAIMDHVPPVFGFPTFTEVANNYSGGKSLGDTFKRLNGSLRPIADGSLHQRIRKRESLPTATQVDFHSDLDVLLGEVVRELAEQ